MKDEPDWTKLPVATPDAIRTLVERCLTKDRRRRLQAIGEARIALENPERAAVRIQPVHEPARSWSRIVATAAIVFLAVVAVWGVVPSCASRAATREPFHDTRPCEYRCHKRIDAIARRVSRLAFVAGPQRQIYVRMMDQFEARPLAGTEDASFLSFSPDGEWIAVSIQQLGTEEDRHQRRKRPGTGEGGGGSGGGLALRPGETTTGSCSITTGCWSGYLPTVANRRCSPGWTVNRERDRILGRSFCRAGVESW